MSPERIPKPEVIRRHIELTRVEASKAFIEVLTEEMAVSAKDAEWAWEDRVGTHGRSFGDLEFLAWCLEEGDVGRALLQFQARNEAELILAGAR